MCDASILWVEDMVATIEGTMHGLSRAGFEITLVADSASAIAKLREHVFGMLIVDHKMPRELGGEPLDGEGVELIHLVRAGEFGPLMERCPIMLLTAQTAAVSSRAKLSHEARVEIAPKNGSHRLILAWAAQNTGRTP